jgi:hypothetical protein
MDSAKLKRANVFKVTLVGAAALSAAVLLTLLYAGTARAQTFTVTNTNDSGTGSLREAIERANATAGADEIVFADGVSGTIILGSTLPTISDPEGLFIDGGGDVTVSGNDAVRVLEVGSGAMLTLSSLTITEGFADEGADGGGILNRGTLELTNATLSSNRVFNDGVNGCCIPELFSAGAGIFNSGGGTVAVTNSTLSNNSATLSIGGAIFNDGGGTVTVTDSTLSGNSAPSQDAFGSSGGGIYNDGTLTVKNSTLSGNNDTAYGAGIATSAGVFVPLGGATVTVANSTFSNNSADGVGGGIAILSGTTTVTNTVTNSTFSGNSAGGGGGIATESGALTLGNTILANNTGGNCEGFFKDAGYNISDDGSCGFSEANGSLSNTDPLLDPTGLQDIGGPTKTIALLPESPAVDLVDQAACPPPQTDQRGVERPQGEACDAGAFELEQAPPPYAFSGFFSPVDNPPTLNVVKAGAAVPVKFSLGGDEGLDIFADGYPISQQIDCSSKAPLDSIEQTLSAGKSSLSYNATTERYTYAWKSKKAWSGTCRQLVVKLDDGSVHRANFKYR